jgi:hypothetical protein
MALFIRSINELRNLSVIPCIMMRDVYGLTRHYDTPLITQHLTEALQIYISDRAADLLLLTLMSSVHTIPSTAFLMLSQVPPLLVAAVCCLLLSDVFSVCIACIICPTALLPCPTLPACPTHLPSSMFY